MRRLVVIFLLVPVFRFECRLRGTLEDPTEASTYRVVLIWEWLLVCALPAESRKSFHDDRSIDMRTVIQCCVVECGLVRDGKACGADILSYIEGFCGRVLPVFMLSETE